MKNLNWAAVLGILGMLCTPTAHAVSILVDYQPKQIQVGESIELRFVLQGITANSPDFLPLKQVFDILYLKPTRTSFSLDSFGNRELSQIWELVVRARKVGRHTLPRIAFGKHFSPARTIEVRAKSATSTPASDAAAVFMTLDVEPEKPYVQQQMRLSLKLYSAGALRLRNFPQGFSHLELTQGDALIKLGERDIRSTVTIKGREYNVLENRYWFFPQRSGSLEMAPVELTLAVPRSAPQPSLFDDPSVFEPSYEHRRFASNALKLTIHPKPDHVKAARWLPAQTLSIQSSGQLIDRPLQVGQAVSFGIKILAQGLTAEQLTAIPVPDIPGLKMYPAAQKTDTQYSAAGASSYLEQNYVVVPTRAGRLHIPELQFTWFNLKQGKEETASLAAQILTVAPAVLANDLNSTRVAGEVSAKEAPAAKSETQPTVPTSGVSLIVDLWFWISVLLLVAWVGTLIYFFGFRKSRPTQEMSTRPHEQADPVNTESFWVRAIKGACAANQARECRSALIGWARCVEYSLENGLAQIDGDFKCELEHLSARVYALPGQELKAWDGEKFWRSFNTARSRFKQERQEETLAPVAPINLL